MLIIGCGDIGKRMCLIANPERDIYAITSKEETARALPEHVTGISIDLDQDFAWPEIPPQAQWFYFVAPGRQAETDTRLQRFLAQVPGTHIPARFTYISTSGVYGDHQGNWVDENTPTNPKTERAKRRVDAELQLAKWTKKNGIDLITLRVPGIVGAGRSMKDRLLTGEPILHPEDAPYTNLIDADELANICLFLAAKAGPGIYNVANDEEPQTMTEHYLQICEEGNIPVPEFIRIEQARETYSPMRMSFINESRRLKIDKLKKIYVFQKQKSPK